MEMRKKIEIIYKVLCDRYNLKICFLMNDSTKTKVTVVTVE